MKEKSLPFILICGLFIFGCNNDEMVVDPKYPTIIKELTDSEIDQIIEQLELTPMAGCQSVDIFGFPFINLDDTLCIDEENWIYDATLQEISDSSISAIETYNTLLNVSNTSEIRILSVETPDGQAYNDFYAEDTDSAPPVWVVTTNQQRYNDLLVRSSNLTLILASDHVVGIGGHWYNFIFIPNYDNYSALDAMESLYNRTFEYERSEIIPTSDMTWYEPKKFIVPIRRSNQIELHVCWALYPSTWEIMVDTQTGEVITKVDISAL